MKLYAHRFKAMGCPCETRLYAQSQQAAQRIFALVEAEAVRIQDKYSRYKVDSLLSKINQAAGTAAVDIDAETFELIQYADRLHEASNGLFDATSGVLRRCWNFNENRIPTESELQQVLPFIGWQQVEFDQRSLCLTKKGMELDFGGFAKEYAVDRCATLIEQEGTTSALVNFGGDLRVIGPQPDGSPWRVGIQHPRKEGAIAFLDLKSGALATSGDYERFIEVNGQRHCHVLNPKTGHSIQPEWAGVSVVSEICMLAGSFTTLALLNKKEFIEHAGLLWRGVDQQITICGNL